MSRQGFLTESGFSLMDLMMTVAVMSIMFGISVPIMRDAVDGMRLGMALRDVEREMQTARLKSVSANRPLRVRFNCPAVGQIRIVEITGVAATDSAANRCDETAFPYPGPRDTNPATPAHDGPVRRLHFSVSVAGPDLQFFPNGTTQQVVSGTPQPIASPVSVTITKGSDYSMVTVNALGKIDIQ